MPAFLVEVYRHPSHESAELAERMCAPSYGAETKDTEIHDTPPIILSGLVKGGEYASVEEWEDRSSPFDVLCISAAGRVVDDFDAAATAAETGALPITWYRYPEEG